VQLLHRQFVQQSYSVNGVLNNFYTILTHLATAGASVSAFNVFNVHLTNVRIITVIIIIIIITIWVKSFDSSGASSAGLSWKKGNKVVVAADN